MKRIGYLPRKRVLEIIDEISKSESISRSKVVGILVEEALDARGIANFGFSNVSKSSIFKSDTLKEIQACEDIYEAFAIRFGEWDSSKGVLKDENPKLRHLVKTIVLGCGYGASANKFSLIAGIPLVEAEKAVGMYRTKMNKVVGLWNDLQRRLHVSYSSLKDFKVPLPSGRSINYGKIKVALLNERRNYVAMVAKGPKKIPVRLWGGLLAENASQALARDIFSDMLLRIEEEGIKTIFHVHDEVVVEEDADKADRQTIF